MQTDLKHWSYSAISQYLRCPRQFHFQRILGLPVRTTPSGLALGSAVHAALATYHLQLQNGEKRRQEVVEQSFHAAWHERETKSEIEYSGNDTRTSCIEQGIALINMYLQEPPLENVIAVESRLTVPLRTSTGDELVLPLLAIADLITESPWGEEIYIHEFKTARRTPSIEEVDSSLQVTCYAHAATELFERRTVVEYIALIKNKKPKIVRHLTKRTITDFQRLGDLVASIERAIDAEVFHPIENQLNCSGCTYRKQCREWSDPMIGSRTELPVLNGSLPC